MPLKTGTSHGFSVLGSLVISGLIVEVLKPAALTFLRPLESASTWIGQQIGYPVQPRLLATLLLAAALAFLWGLIFQAWRDRREG